MSSRDDGAPARAGQRRDAVSLRDRRHRGVQLDAVHVGAPLRHRT
jgi:hypothetical protein